MKTKIIIFILMALIFVTIVGAEQCEDIVQEYAECSLVTPELSCASYTYEIFNVTNSTPSANPITTGTLTQLNGSVYYFVFNETNGNYQIRLCDGTNSAIYVEADDSMMIAIGMVFGIFAVIFIGTGIFLVLRRKFHNDE